MQRRYSSIRSAKMIVGARSIYGIYNKGKIQGELPELAKGGPAESYLRRPQGLRSARTGR
jgi:hypothetical protein